MAIEYFKRNNVEHKILILPEHLGLNGNNKINKLGQIYVHHVCENIFQITGFKKDHFPIVDRNKPLHKRTSAIYFYIKFHFDTFWDVNYIGETEDIFQRLNMHRWKKKKFVFESNCLFYFDPRFYHPINQKHIEQILISKWRPLYNREKHRKFADNYQQKLNEIGIIEDEIIRKSIVGHGKHNVQHVL